ncbi:hypothetical protein BH20ACT10_BH20ACT10_01670 [soil metagenome]|jgi:hypothetical protein|nr:hypothetical protein [Rubrobacter sp.]
MNAFNRFLLLVVAILLIAFPVLFLLINFGGLQADLINQFTNYQAGVEALGGIVNADLTATAVRISIAVAGALVAIIALLFLLRELTFGKRVSRRAVIDDSPGSETSLTTKAVKSLAEGAAREAGAESPSASLSSPKGKPYLVECAIGVPRSGNYTEVASRVRENVRSVLESQQVEVKDVEVTVQRSAS